MLLLSISSFLAFLQSSLFVVGYISKNSLFPEPLSSDEELIYFLASKDLYPEDIQNILRDICMSNNKMGSLFLKKVSEKEITPKLALDMLYAVSMGKAKDHFLPVYENIDFFMEHLDNTLDLYNKVKDNKEAQDKVKDYMRKHIDEVVTKVRPSQLAALSKLFDEPEVRKKVVDYALDHFEEIINDYSPLTMFDTFIKDIEGVPELEEKRIDYVNNHFDEIAKKMYCFLNYNATKENVLSLEQSEDREAIVEIIRM